MWIKATTQDILRRNSYDTHLNFLWKADGLPLYIMDNHLAAAWCWMQECSSEESYQFFHIDRHNDLGALAPTKLFNSFRIGLGNVYMLHIRAWMTVREG